VNQVLQQVEGDEERIKTIFLVVLSRVPDAEEMEFCLDFIKSEDSSDRAYRNLISGLITSQEFYFIF